MTGMVTLDALDLAFAALFLLVNAGLSLWLNLGLAGQLAIAAVRMVVQLLLIGLVLKALFATASPLWTGVAAVIMVTAAGREVMARQERRLKGWWAYGLGTTAMLAAAGLVMVLALTTQVRPDPWYHPQYAIPMLGMVLGNTMTGISLGLNTLVTSARRERPAIEARLALGGDRWQAMRPTLRSAVRTAMIPIINAMAAAGLVSLPGMMTGQILAGTDPVEAVKYQMLIFFLIAGGTGIGVFAALTAGARRLTDDRHRLRLDRLSNPS